MSIHCDGEHAAPTCKDPECYHRDPLAPCIDAELVMFRAPDGEAIYLDDVEAFDLAAKLITAAHELTRLSPEEIDDLTQALDCAILQGGAWLDGAASLRGQEARWKTLRTKLRARIKGR